jgi:hypothetical protein
MRALAGWFNIEQSDLTFESARFGGDLTDSWV